MRDAIVYLRDSVRVFALLSVEMFFSASLADFPLRSLLLKLFSAYSAHILRVLCGQKLVLATRGFLCLHAIAITPAGPMKLVRSSISIVRGLPCVTVRSAPAIVVSGPAQRSLTLWPARSPSRLATLYIESSDSFVASTIVSIATGWSEPVPGREFHPLKSSAFSRRTVTPTTCVMIFFR